LADVEKLINENAQMVVEEMTSDLRSRAKKSGWSDDLTNNMQVSYTKDNLQVDYPEQHENAIYDSEYGNKEVPHKAAIRPFSNNLDKYVVKIFDDAVIDGLITETKAFHG
jgi:hypothetical protein